MIKNITWSQYTQSKSLPVLMDVRDMIKYHVNKEAESNYVGYNYPIPKYEKEKQKWSVTAMVGFRNAIMGFIP